MGITIWNILGFVCAAGVVKVVHHLIAYYINPTVAFLFWLGTVCATVWLMFPYPPEAEWKMAESWQDFATGALVGAVVFRWLQYGDYWRRDRLWPR